jgi:hypothetical protein
MEIDIKDAVNYMKKCLLRNRIINEIVYLHTKLN